MTAARRRHPERHARVGRANARCGVQVRAANARTRRGGGSKAVPVELDLGAKGRNRSAEASSRAPCEGGPGQCQVWGAGACSQRENPEGRRF